ncbi:MULTISPECIES: uracil-DNA glycosylase [Acidiphilium]|uniref:Type-4 uracil-DNA glycosylase n=1 Tax=Acidiphilium rubrum TaxID=526 RepID=A0A8G2CKD2_ACIRU|nr:MULTISPECIES: uracil-DNA glycosylase [Acidiphilium]SIQ72973.1 DNA polymerase [Acidiphilium rubrum]
MQSPDPVPPDLALAWLALQAEWGAVDGLADAPQDHTQPPPRAEPTRPIPLRPTTHSPPRPAAAPTTAAPAPAMSLAGLRAALEAFDDCALKRTATQLVFADGSETARIMLIGEAPGGEEDRAGRPFVGPAGQLLDRMLASIGLDRTQVRIVNVVPWRPPGNRNPSEAEIAQCLPFLHQHIALIRPQRLLLLGAVAVRALIGGKEGISRVRGSWKSVTIPGLDQPVRALPTYHPAFLLRQPSAKRLAWTDLLTLRQDCVEDSVLLNAAPQKQQSITES